MLLIVSGRTHGVLRKTQAGLNEIAKAPELTKVPHDEVASRGLGLEAATPCIALVYEKVFQRARGNDCIITLYKGAVARKNGVHNNNTLVRTQHTHLTPPPQPLERYT